MYTFSTRFELEIEEVLGGLIADQESRYRVVLKVLTFIPPIPPALLLDLTFIYAILKRSRSMPRSLMVLIRIQTREKPVRQGLT
jgi:hypothetical protein